MSNNECLKQIYFVNLFDPEGKYYDSYKEEFWALVNLSKFQTCALGDINYKSDNIYICFLRNGNTHAAFSHDQAKDHKCKLILWLQEWGKWEKGKLETGYYEDTGASKGFTLNNYWDEVWVSDRYFQNLLSEINPSAIVKYVFFGGHPQFGGEPSSFKKWDFCHLSYAYGTRKHKYEILANNGYTFAPSSYHFHNASPSKSESLSQSRWGLALQQFNTPFVNHQRLTLFASWKLPIITDFIKDPYPYWVFPEGMIHFNPNDTICGNAKIMQEAAEYNHHIVTTRTFRQSVEDTVKGLQIN